MRRPATGAHGIHEPSAADVRQPECRELIGTDADEFAAQLDEGAASQPGILVGVAPRED